MKKIVMMIALIMGMAVSANAQTALVDNGAAKDNWYIGGGIGTNVWNDVTSWSLFNGKCVETDHSWWRTQPLYVDVYGGKMITPYIGFELDYAALFNLMHSATFLDAHNLTGNVVINVTNVVAGYKGKKRAVEIEVLGGVGWLHAFDSDYGAATTKNAISVRGAVRGNIKVSRYLAITITPEYVWIPDAFMVGDNLQGVNLYVGVKYNIPSKRGGFPIKALRSQAEIDDLNATIAELKAQNTSLTKTNADLAEVIKNLTGQGEKVMIKTQNIGSIYFEKGKYDVDSDEVANAVTSLKETSGSIVLTGTTSPEGSEVYNKELAINRANAVKDALVANGIEEERIRVNDNYETQRSVVIVVE